MDDFVTFEIAKKLKEKGFDYNEPGIFHKLYSSAGFAVVYGVNFREYYDYNDFDEHDYICPTISQVLKWLREKYFIHISTKPYPCEDGIMWLCEIRKFSEYISIVVANKTGFIKEAQAAIAGIEYVLDNLI